MKINFLRKMTKKTTTVNFRRKREGRTDFGKRLNLLKSGKPRLVVRRSLRYLLFQLVEYSSTGDKVVISYNSKALTKLGWKSSAITIPACYLAGMVMGKLVAKKDIKVAVLDIGLHASVKGSRIYAAVKGLIDSGLNIRCNDKMFPAQERLEGKHLKSGKQSEEISSVRSKIEGM